MLQSFIDFVDSERFTTLLMVAIFISFFVRWYYLYTTLKIEIEKVGDAQAKNDYDMKLLLSAVGVILVEVLGYSVLKTF